MKLKSLLLASGVAVFATAGAHAADAITAQEPTPVAITPSFSWTGAYIGGQVGYGWGKSTLKAEDEPQRIKTDGFLGGLYAGYNFDVGNNVILGVDGDVTFNDLKEKRVTTDDVFGTSVLEQKLRWSGAVRARAGVAVDRFLPYIAGGVAFARVNNSLSISNDFFGYEASQSKTLTGWTLGAGVDYAATDNLILRLEYRYTDYGSKDFDPTNSDGFGYLLNANVKTNDVRLGAAYKF